MKAFNHFSPATVPEALKLLKTYGEKARPLAGGTDLLCEIIRGSAQPDYLINLKSIPDSSYITEAAEGIKIGAVTTLSQIETHPLIRRRYPSIAQAAHSVASPQIRNMGSIGGNLLQEVRCWYYRACEPQGPFICIRKGGATCYARNGNHRYYHSIFGHLNGCHATSTSDMATVLLSMAATVRIAGSSGERIVPLEQIYAAPHLKPALGPDEILLEIQLPKLPPDTRSLFYKLRVRKAIDSAIVSAAVSAALEDRVCKDIRMTLGGVFPKPYRAEKAEEILRGQMVGEETATQAARAVMKTAAPLPLNSYKVDMAGNLIKRLVLNLVP